MGRVYFVGAGPGRPDLLTLRGRDCIARADIVLTDDLVHPEVYGRHARPEAEIIYTGKRAGQRSIPQAELVALIIEHAQAGRIVTRLKGGDPSVFGRLREEIDGVVAAGIDYEVVPGVTAASGASAYAGPLLTERQTGRAVTYMTGTTADESVNWQMATEVGTVVVYMGILAVEKHVDSLLAHGIDPAMPVVIVRSATLGYEESWRTTVGDLASTVTKFNIRPPALWVIGRRIEAALMPGWRAGLPLHGITLLTTRADQRGYVVAEELRELGAEVVNIATRKIVALNADSAQWRDRTVDSTAVLHVFTSRSAEEYANWRDIDQALVFDRPAGKATSYDDSQAVVESLGRKVADWAQKLSSLPAGTAIVHWCSPQRRPELQQMCAQSGLQYIAQECFDFVEHTYGLDELERQLRKLPSSTVILATSTQSFAVGWQHCGPAIADHTIWSIGSTTTNDLAAMGITVDHTLDLRSGESLAQVLTRDLAKLSGSIQGTM